MSRVLITGATGFIGRQCIKLLNQLNVEIHAVTSQDIIDNDITFHKVNLLDTSKIYNLFKDTKPDYLLHLAWVTDHTKYWSDISNLDWVQSSIEMIKMFKKFNGKKIVVAGTCAEYDWNYGLCTELLTPLKPFSFYGVCKKSLYDILVKFSDEYELDYSWARIFFVYGPFENKNKLIPYIINSLLDNKKAYCANPYQVRDFIHIEDAASILVKLLFSEYRGPINVGSGESVSIEEIARYIGLTLNKTDLIEINDQKPRKIEYPFVIANNNLLKEKLDFDFTYNMNQGINQTIEWWKNYNEQYK